ncbi:hypothetical protein PoB_006004500 [Plakobranchus ocellatus]|uniref:Uncharacterized protein n=1 Tax=Plakobranchus ocellatus TaxID=259542 RepID=A0AAV4CNT4_9GAST|nr:hypothetical protein PoB_006004500 [Plakobranchus ocellatus]
MTGALPAPSPSPQPPAAVWQRPLTQAGGKTHRLWRVSGGGVLSMTSDSDSVARVTLVYSSIKKSGRKPEFFHESRESPPVWGTRNFTACSKRPGTSLGRSSGESPRLGRCVQVEKTKRLDGVLPSLAHCHPSPTAP